MPLEICRCRTALSFKLPGLAYRAPEELIGEHILSCSALHELLMNYSQRVMHQLAQSALCNRFHTSVQRLARWLLLTAERADTNRFELTHEFMAQMVGAPRSAVSESASMLRDKEIIDYRRGVLTTKTRSGSTRSRANVSMSCPRRQMAPAPGWSIPSKDQ